MCRLAPVNGARRLGAAAEPLRIAPPAPGSAATGGGGGGGGGGGRASSSRDGSASRSGRSSVWRSSAHEVIPVCESVSSTEGREPAREQRANGAAATAERGGDRVVVKVVDVAQGQRRALARKEARPAVGAAANASAPAADASGAAAARSASRRVRVCSASRNAARTDVRYSQPSSACGSRSEECRRNATIATSWATSAAASRSPSTPESGPEPDAHRAGQNLLLGIWHSHWNGQRECAVHIN